MSKEKQLKLYECCLAQPDFLWSSNIEAYSFEECLQHLKAIKFSMEIASNNTLTQLRITKIAEL